MFETHWNKKIKNSYFGPFLSQNSQSGNTFCALEIENSITTATLYLLFTTKIKALPLLVLEIWQVLEAPDLTDFQTFSENRNLKKCRQQQYKGIALLI